MKNANLYELIDLHKDFRLEEGRIEVLRGINLELPRGCWTALLGASGSGKTTLLQLLGGLDQPSSGKILLEGEDLGSSSAARLSALRRHKIGFVFQSYHLFPELSALENAALPALQLRSSRGQAFERAKRLLDEFGLARRLEHRPRELSGGEQQRVAVARALINQPEIILADEPTGNLDQEAATEILDILAQLQREQKCSIIMVTHDRSVAARSQLCIRLHEGKASESTLDA